MRYWSQRAVGTVEYGVFSLGHTNWRLMDGSDHTLGQSGIRPYAWIAI
jgi:hypothetical protein